MTKHFEKLALTRRGFVVATGIERSLAHAALTSSMTGD